jgi:ADP-heptose:LPS heptosyltransferase
MRVESMKQLSARIIAAQAVLCALVSRWLRISPEVRVSAADGGDPTRILVVRPDEIGDVVLSTSFLRELRHNFPAASITLVVNPVAYDLVKRCPYVDEVLVFDQRVRRFWRPVLLPMRALVYALRYLRKRDFDLAVLPRWGTDAVYAAFLACFSGARRRVGFTEHVTAHKARWNAGFDRLFTDVIPVGPLKHQVEHNLDVVRFLGGEVVEGHLELWTEPDDERFADEVLAGVNDGAGPVVALAPSGGHSRLKQWPTERFIALGRLLREEWAAHIVVVGGPGDAFIGEEFRAEFGDQITDLVGRTSLSGMAAVLKRVDLFVGNDAGPLHIAAAVGAPAVAIFGSSDPVRFGPWGEHRLLWTELPCSPTRQADHPDRCRTCLYDAPRCLLGIGVTDVADACASLLGKSPREYRRSRFRSMFASPPAQEHTRG